MSIVGGTYFKVCDQIAKPRFVDEAYVITDLLRSMMSVEHTSDS